MVRKCGLHLAVRVIMLNKIQLCILYFVERGATVNTAGTCIHGCDLYWGVFEIFVVVRKQNPIPSEILMQIFKCLYVFNLEF